jgi:hypothetical protein
MEKKLLIILIKSNFLEFKEFFILRLANKRLSR